jgi:putative inorganic carbon (HCO3(-)) transporter
MRTASFLRPTNLARLGLVLLAIIVASAAGLPALAVQSPLAPLILGAAVLAAAFVAVSLHNPIWGLYGAILVGLLPEQVLSLLPISIIRDYSVVFALLFACASWLLSVVGRRRKIVWTITDLAMLAFLAWGITTLLWAPDPVAGRRQLMAYIVGFVLLLLVVNEVNSRRALDGLMATLALSGWGLVLASVGTVLTQGYMPGTRLSVLGMNENEMGMVVLVTMMGVLWQVTQPSTRHRQVKKLLPWVFLLMTMGLVAASGSRGSAISLLAVLLGFCIWRPTRAWGVVGLLVLAVGGILTPLVFSTTLERFAITQGDTLLGGREALWRAAWNLIRDQPWRGVGLGNARQALVPYVLLLRTVEDTQSVAVHNPILQVWAETGLPGILIYLTILGSAVWLFVRQYLYYRRTGIQALIPYLALVSSTFLGYMTSWIKGGAMEAAFIYFLLIGLLLVPSHLPPEPRQGTMGDPTAVHDSTVEA